MNENIHTDRAMTPEEFQEFLQALHAEQVEEDDGEGVKVITVDDAQKMMDEACTSQEDVFHRNYTVLKDNKASVKVDAADFIVLTSLASQFYISEKLAQLHFGTPIPYNNVSQEAVENAFKKLNKLREKYDLTPVNNIVLSKDEEGNPVAVNDSANLVEVSDGE